MLAQSPSQEALVRSPLYRALSEEEGGNSIVPTYRGSPLAAAPIHLGVPGAGRTNMSDDGLLLPGTPNEVRQAVGEHSATGGAHAAQDDAHRLSNYTTRARVDDGMLASISGDDEAKRAQCPKRPAASAARRHRPAPRTSQPAARPTPAACPLAPSGPDAFAAARGHSHTRFVLDRDIADNPLLHV